MPRKGFFHYSKQKKKREGPQFSFFKKMDRIVYLQIFMIFLVAGILTRLFWMQVIQYREYKIEAQAAHTSIKKLFPKRGEIFIHDLYGKAQTSADTYLGDQMVFPAVINRDYILVYAVPKYVLEGEKTAEVLSPLLEIDKETLLQKFQKKDDLYEVLKKKVPQDKADEIKKLNLTGIYFDVERNRFYTEPGFGGHVFGFVGHVKDSLRGLYGLEGYFDELLKGRVGSQKLEKDAIGSLIPVGVQENVDAIDGSTLILTLERTVQLMACDKLKKWVTEHGADGGSAIIMEPQTGRILALCSTPDFDPNTYSQFDFHTYNNPALFTPYEPGSIFKPLTMAMGLDMGKVTPTTIYNDTGNVSIGSFNIKNSDLKAHGKQTMTDVLDKSLNTGAIFVARKVGIKNFRTYVKDFGFAEKTGIELNTEVKGDISSLNDEKREIYLATASFGQGISVTPLQIITAFAALANGGNLVKPTIIDDIIHPDGKHEKTVPRIVRRVISEQAASLVSGMLVSVVRNGHGKKAGVPLYYVAGKTGTAQVPRKDKRGYEANATIGSFVGYAPVQHPKFVMLVKIDHPRDVQWAESSAAPLFGELAKFLLQYYEVPPDEQEQEKKKK